MNPSHRILINTIASYSRTIIGVALSLFSSRWILDALGVSDYGIYSLIGSLIVVVAFLNTVLSNGDARFFSIEIGKGQSGDMPVLFKSMLILHVIVPIIVLSIGYVISRFAVLNLLNIPVDRIDVALIVLNIVFVSSLVGFIVVPFTSLFIAYQNIVFSSIISLFSSFLSFLAAFCLRYINGDKLVAYSFFVAVIQIMFYMIYVIVAMNKYGCCKASFHVKADKKVVLSVLKFSFWHLLGDFGHLILTQGVSIVANLIFGTTANAAIGIASNVGQQSANLTNALITSSSPEINRRVGAGETENISGFSHFISKNAVLLNLIISVPLIISMNSILDVWLVEVPPHTGILCSFFILMYAIEKINVGELSLLKAMNKLAIVESCILFGYSLSVIFPYCGLCSYFGVAGIGISCVLAMIISRIGIVFCSCHYFSYNTRSLVLRIILPLTMFLSLSFFIQESLKVNYNLIHIIVYSIITDVLLIPLIFLTVFDKGERTKLKTSLFKILKITKI